MKLLICVFFASLFMDIPLNYLFICVLTNRIYIVPITPKLTTPKLSFHLWMKSKQFFCRNTLYCLNNILGRHHRNTLYHKMNVVLICTNLHKMYFKPLLDIPAYINQTPFHGFRQNISSIFYRTNQMIQQ